MFSSATPDALRKQSFLRLSAAFAAYIQTDVESKKLHATDRPMTTPLFLLRCVQLGISIRGLDLLTIGMVNDMYAESSNDEYKGYAQIATQRDFGLF